MTAAGPEREVRAVTLAEVSLDDKYTKEQGRIFLTGIQALVRLPMLQRQRDLAAGLNTAGFVSGYRGSPLGGFDQQLAAARRFLDQHHIIFQPGVNEDLAATALWGTQQVELLGEGRYDGVFGMWYGKGPGVDRTGDAFKHGNLAGTARAGRRAGAGGRRPRLRVLDHGASERVRAGRRDDAGAQPGRRRRDPRLRPVGLRAVALQRLLGRPQVRPRHGQHRGLDRARPGPRRRSRRPTISSCRRAGSTSAGRTRRSPRSSACTATSCEAARAFARANRFDRLVLDSPDARGSASSPPASPISTCARRSTISASTPALAARLGLRVFKVGLVWPLEPRARARLRRGLEQIIVVEEKRAADRDPAQGAALRPRERAADRRQARRAGPTAVPVPRRALQQPDRAGASPSASCGSIGTTRSRRG